MGSILPRNDPANLALLCLNAIAKKGNTVFLPSVNNAVMPKLYIKFTHLYSFKIDAFQVY